MYYHPRRSANEDRVFKQRQYENALQEKLRFVRRYETLMRYAQFEEVSEPRASYRDLSEKLAAVRARRERALEERRSRLRELLDREDADLSTEIRAGTMNLAERRAWLKARALSESARRWKHQDPPMWSRSHGRDRQVSSTELEKAMWRSHEDMAMHDSRAALREAFCEAEKEKDPRTRKYRRHGREEADSAEDRPHISDDGDGDRPHISDDGDGDRPHISDDGDGTRPHISDHGDGDRPHISDHGDGTRPHISDHGDGTRPHISDHGDGDRPHISDDGDGTRPHISDDGDGAAACCGVQSAREILGSHLHMAEHLRADEKIAVEEDLVQMNSRWLDEEEELRRSHAEQRLQQSLELQSELSASGLGLGLGLGLGCDPGNADPRISVMLAAREARDRREVEDLRASQRREAIAYAEQLRRAVENRRFEDEELAELINARMSEEPCHSYGPRPRCAGIGEGAREDERTTIKDNRKLYKEDPVNALEGQIRGLNAVELVDQEMKLLGLEGQGNNKEHRAADARQKPKTSSDAATAGVYAEPYFGRKAVKWYS